MKKLLLAASALSFIAVPQAQAQLLSGSGIGQVTGSIGSPLDSVRSLPRETLRSTVRGEARGEARTRGSQNVDRRSGRVSAERSIDTGVTAAASDLVETPLVSGQGSASGEGRASGSGSAEAQLIGTDGVRAIAGEGAARARGTVSTVRNVAIPAAGAARDRAGSLAGQAVGAASAAGSGEGSGSAAGEGSANGLGSMFAAAGSAAAAGQGAFAIAPGMPVVASDGAAVGKVRQIVSDSRGRVEQVIVEARGQDLAIPAGNLAAGADALVIAQGAGSATVTED
ncbi:hypothetical protein GRI72_01290 [Altererythrobacter marinus]|uniref:PRC-barrel domain-containing protein n=1 Tax=Pelagerythrobacter marinus TaxID=538382 RepID=A0ABW9URF4_9SPHN|nr:PRC-barrel domain-containing protein [Pelagerythrobacter marinus]MXO67466.1 hypothetical protein [Pelagerythrobacter marinus]